MTHRGTIAAAAALTFACTTACAARSIRTVDRGPSDLVALLPDPDGGAVGRAVVTTPAGAVDLAAARDSTTIARNSPPAPVTTLSEQDVQHIFGDALASLPPPPQSFTLYFHFESEELTDESRALAERVLETVKGRPFPEVVVRGHTDTTGSAAQNFELGLKRAHTVRSLLIKTGVDESSIEVISHGESELLVPTADEVFEPRNRRVEITVR